MTETMLQAAVLTVLVLVLRQLLRRRVRQRTICLLWLPVLLRLMLPGVFFTLPARSGAQGAVTQTAERLQTVMDGLSMEPVRVSGAAPDVAQFAAIDAQAVFVTVWNLGSVLLLIWMLAVNLRFAHRLKQERVLLSYSGKLPVYTVPALPSPCLALAGGRLGIYVPEALAAEDEQLRHILAHETAHARRFDHIWELFRLWLAVLYWWNPLVWLAISCSRQDGELACDEAALETLGEAERLRYGHTLVALAERCTNRRGFACAASMSRGGRALRERIRQVAHRPEPSKMAALLAVLLLTLGSAAAFTTAAVTDDPFDGAVIYTKISLLPAKTHWLHVFSFRSNAVSAGEIAKEYFDLYADKLQAHWAASGYPLEEVALFDLNAGIPDTPAEDAVGFTAVYAIRPKENPLLSSQNLSGLLTGFVPGHGALEGWLLAAEPMAAVRGADGDWEASEPSAGLPILNNGYRSLTLQELCELISLKDIGFGDFLRYHAEDGGSYYFRSYPVADTACTLYTARKNTAGAPLYLILLNHETGESADLREGLSAVCAAADSPGYEKNVLTRAELEPAIAAVQAFVASHPVWQDAEIYYDPYANQLNHDIQLGVYTRGYTKKNVLTLLCDFTAGEGPVLEPGERYTNYQFILARRSASEPWEIVDQGY